MTVSVTFDKHVVVVGEPILNLNTGKVEPGRAAYAGGSGNKVRRENCGRRSTLANNDAIVC